jgi:hypothetical protein
MNSCPNCGEPRSIFRYCRKCRCDLEEYDRRLEEDEWYAGLDADEKAEYGPYEPQARKFKFERKVIDSLKERDLRVSGAARLLGAEPGRLRAWNAAAFVIGTCIVPAAYALKYSSPREAAGSILVSLVSSIAVWASFRLVRNEWIAAVVASLMGALIIGLAWLRLRGTTSLSEADIVEVRSRVETLLPVFLAWLLALVWITRKTGSTLLAVIGSLAARAGVAVGLPWLLWYWGYGTIEMPNGPEAALYGMVRHIGGAAVVTAWFWGFLLYCPKLTITARSEKSKRNPAP